MVVPDERSWTASRDHCRSLGADLVSIHNNPDNSAVMVLARDSLPVWIGLNKVRKERLPRLLLNELLCK